MPTKTNKSKRFYVNVTFDDHEKLRGEAELLGITMASLIRLRILGVSVRKIEAA